MGTPSRDALMEALTIQVMRLLDGQGECIAVAELEKLLLGVQAEAAAEARQAHRDAVGSKR